MFYFNNFAITDEVALNTDIFLMYAEYDSVTDTWPASKSKIFINPAYENQLTLYKSSGIFNPSDIISIDESSNEAILYNPATMDISKIAGINLFHTIEYTDGTVSSQFVFCINSGNIQIKDVSDSVSKYFIAGNTYYINNDTIGKLTTVKPITGKVIVFGTSFQDDNININIMEEPIPFNFNLLNPEANKFLSADNELNPLWLSIQQGGGLTSITYADLLLGLNSGIIKVGYYCITDFATRYTQPVTNTVLTGTVEPLIVLATSSFGGEYADKINSNAYSTIYPEDEISYELTTDIDIAANKGFIYFRRDKKTDTSTYYDFRVIQYRRYKLLPNQWNSSTMYPQWSAVAYAGDIYVCKLQNIAIEPTITVNWTNYWQKIISSYSTKYISWDMNNLLIGSITIPVDNNTYTDYSTFNGSTKKSNIGLSNSNRYNNIIISNTNGNTCNIGKDCFNGNITMPYSVNLNQSCYNFIISSDVHIDAAFVNNIITLEYSVHQHIDIYSCYNLIFDDQAELYADLCVNIIVGKNIVNTKMQNCNTIVISNNCKNNYLEDCISVSLPANSWGNRMYGVHTILFNMLTPLYYNVFRYNITEDYTLATHIYNQYSCTIQLAADSSDVLTYFSNSSTMVIVPATS